MGPPSQPVVLLEEMAMSCVGISHLRKLRIRAEEAVTHGCSSKGPWTLSSSRAAHEALSLEYLARDGLPSRVAFGRHSPRRK